MPASTSAWLQPILAGVLAMFSSPDFTQDSHTQILDPGNNAEEQRYDSYPSAFEKWGMASLTPAQDSITTTTQDLLKLERKLRKRKSARIDVHQLEGGIEFFTDPFLVPFLFESYATKNIQQIIDEILHTLEREDEASTSHRARAEPERRSQLVSTTNDRVGRMVAELRRQLFSHIDLSTNYGQKPHECRICIHKFATSIMLDGHVDLAHKKISVNGVQPLPILYQ